MKVSILTVAVAFIAGASAQTCPEIVEQCKQETGYTSYDLSAIDFEQGSYCPEVKKLAASKQADFVACIVKANPKCEESSFSHDPLTQGSFLKKYFLVSNCPTDCKDECESVGKVLKSIETTYHSACNVATTGCGWDAFLYSQFEKKARNPFENGEITVCEYFKFTKELKFNDHLSCLKTLEDNVCKNDDGFKRDKDSYARYSRYECLSECKDDCELLRDSAKELLGIGEGSTDCSEVLPKCRDETGYTSYDFSAIDFKQGSYCPEVKKLAASKQADFVACIVKANPKCKESSFSHDPLTQASFLKNSFLVSSCPTDCKDECESVGKVLKSIETTYHSACKVATTGCGWDAFLYSQFEKKARNPFEDGEITECEFFKFTKELKFNDHVSCLKTLEDNVCKNDDGFKEDKDSYARYSRYECPSECKDDCELLRDSAKELLGIGVENPEGNTTGTSAAVPVTVSFATAVLAFARFLF